MSRIDFIPRNLQAIGIKYRKILYSILKYTIQNLSVLDSYGLKITRNEIYARHGRIFNDQELQEYFQRQNWYVPQTASNDFDDSCLNEVEKYNIQLISTYEQQAGGN